VNFIFIIIIIKVSNKKYLNQEFNVAEFMVVVGELKSELPGFEAEFEVLVKEFKETALRLAKSDPDYKIEDLLIDASTAFKAVAKEIKGYRELKSLGEVDGEVVKDIREYS
jgi:hypothetical protein